MFNTVPASALRSHIHDNRNKFRSFAELDCRIGQVGAEFGGSDSKLNRTSYEVLALDILETSEATLDVWQIQLLDPVECQTPLGWAVNGHIEVSRERDCHSEFPDEDDDLLTVPTYADNGEEVFIEFVWSNHYEIEVRAPLENLPDWIAEIVEFHTGIDPKGLIAGGRDD